MSTVPVVPPLKARVIEQRALTFLKEHSPNVFSQNKPTPVDRFFEFTIPNNLGMNTYYTSLQSFGIDAEGYTNARQKVSIVDQRLADDFSERGRRRFRATVGHEIGHCMLHASLRRWQLSLQIVGKGMKRERSDLEAFEDPEWQAWRYCHALCMPEPSVRGMVEKYGVGESGVRALMERFDVNRTFVQERLRMLKIIPR